ncbi:hypothetical protein CUJ84_Chr003251 [Rhizobium leguminosarum]|uniref:Uncharacterized protein n=1 Tax=Rhizobium leguminosarum TaxID=384 RepID=A0A2K9Z657_RHILE|nr:hypothetical protein CUJ84_Chr003251 [Rhizobium leguminosarum]
MLERPLCVQMDARRSKARCDLSDSRLALEFFVLTHVVIAKPLHTFARHALIPSSEGAHLREFPIRSA